MTREELKTFLIELFPGFSSVWEDSYLYKDKDLYGTYTFHGLLFEFTIYFRDHFSEFSDEQLTTLFSTLEAHMLDEDLSRTETNLDGAALLSNAISAGFLELITEYGFTNRLIKFLGPKSFDIYVYYDSEASKLINNV